MNQIDQFRINMARYLQKASLLSDKHETYDSPTGNYRMEIDVFRSSTYSAHRYLSVATITDQRNEEHVATIARNYDPFWHCWLEYNGVEYLLCSEDFEGETVVDLMHRRTESYSSKEDRFIWAEFYPSPSRNRIAIIGCYWACPYEVIVYDFTDPLNLPLKRLTEITLPDNCAQFKEWLSDDEFTVEEDTGEVHHFIISQSD